MFLKFTWHLTGLVKSKQITLAPIKTEYSVQQNFRQQEDRDMTVIKSNVCCIYRKQMLTFIKTNLCKVFNK